MFIRIFSQEKIKGVRGRREGNQARVNYQAKLHRHNTAAKLILQLSHVGQESWSIELPVLHRCQSLVKDRDMET